MPNHCSNRVSFYSDNESDIQKLHSIFLKGIENDDNTETTGTVFGSFIPEPNWEEIPLTENTVQEYTWDKPRGEVGEKPVMVINEESPFMNGLRFKSTNKQDDRWYNWRCQNWGTKWDCYTLDIEDSDMPHGFEVTFETAWSPPEEVCSAIREQYPNVSISWFYDEPGCEIAGYL